LAIEPHFPDDSADRSRLRLWLSFGRRSFVDLSIFGGLLSARYAISAEIS
jgi:hypothetical protein